MERLPPFVADARDPHARAPTAAEATRAGEGDHWVGALARTLTASSARSPSTNSEMFTLLAP